MDSSKFALYSRQVVLPDSIGAYSILINQGKIQDIVQGPYSSDDYPIIDYEDAVIMPGMIDPHVHINEPGRTEWEGFDSGCTAAAAGGITTLVEMPLNASPVTTTTEALRLKLAAAASKTHIHCGFYGGIVPGNHHELQALSAAGVIGFKAFLTHSGIDEFPNVDEATLKAAYQTLKGSSLPILAHCELESGQHDSYLQNEKGNYQAYLASRPKQWENDAVALMIDLARFYQHPTHIVHLSSAQALPLIRSAKASSVPLTVETCPHYLYFNAEDIPNKDTRFKCAPPIREKENNERLWEAVLDGSIDFIGSDHSPAPPSIKALNSGNLLDAWGGISAIQYSLPALWTKGQKFGLKLEDIRRLCCEAPAAFIGYAASKGRLAKGYDADIVVWQANQFFEVTRSTILARHKLSPYENQQLQGQVVATYIKGTKVFEPTKLVARNCGDLLRL